LNRAERRQKEIVAETAGSSGSKTWIYAIIGVVVVVVIGGLIVFSQPSPSTVGGITFPTGVVHWHAFPSVEICGQDVLLPVPNPGQGHLGSPLLHTHDDRWIHVEGAVNSPNDITLGKYFDFIGVNFSSTQLMDKTNGDLCNGVPGQVQLFINGSESFEFGDHIIMDQEKILLKFGS
jgi:hypothetical protein